ncbi:hypothetical protein QP203_20060 [Escherichia coli]|nr:hypothetical protein [Escherichia coli]
MDIQKTEIFVYAPGNGALITGIPFMATAFLALLRITVKEIGE